MVKRIAPFAFLLLAACATAGSASGQLQPGKWRFVLIDGKRPVSGAAMLSIKPDRIGANVGCNGMGGELSIARGRLNVGPMVSTRLWCDGVMTQERAVERMLAASPAYRLRRGHLVLAGAGHTAELEALRQPAPDAP